MKKLAFVLLALLAAGCPPPAPPVEPEPEPPPDPWEPPPSPPGPETVADACANLRALHCKAGDPTPGGKTCEDVLQATQDGGIFRQDLGCLTALKSCDDQRGCARRP